MPLFNCAPLQRPLVARILARHGANPADLDTVYVVVSYNQPDGLSSRDLTPSPSCSNNSASANSPL